MYSEWVYEIHTVFTALLLLNLEEQTNHSNKMDLTYTCNISLVHVVCTFSLMYCILYWEHRAKHGAKLIIIVTHSQLTFAGLCSLREACEECSDSRDLLSSEARELASLFRDSCDPCLAITSLRPSRVGWGTGASVSFKSEKAECNKCKIKDTNLIPTNEKQVCLSKSKLKRIEKQ